MTAVFFEAGMHAFSNFPSFLVDLSSGTLGLKFVDGWQTAAQAEVVGIPMFFFGNLEGLESFDV